MNGLQRMLGSKSAEERKQAMFASLNVGNIPNHNPHYQQAVKNPLSSTVADSGQKKLITVTLDKLKPYDGNPRKTRNPAYDEIKASIKARGLDHAPNVTQFPGDSFYTIADGGNTRLQALKELFAETQDLRFWSIECVFKPWQGEADDINSKIDMMIGHLAENEIRGELAFIEKALGVKEVKTLYEARYQENFSHRKLAEKLSEDGYPISNQIIARMDQCLTYLYPHIPNVLLAGLGKPQIEKLLAIHRNGANSWEIHSLKAESQIDFDEIWLESLSPFDEQPEEFAVSAFQDQLIGKMLEALNYRISYESLKLEIDLEERKQQRLLEKQREIIQLAEASEERVQHLHEQLKEKEPLSEPVKSVKIATPTAVKLPKPTVAIQESEDELDEMEAEQAEAAAFDDDETLELPSFEVDNSLSNAMVEHLAGFGIEAGQHPEQQRADEAVKNGLSFANTGRQPVTNLWKIHPNRSHTLEAYSLAMDIAETFGLEHLIEHQIHEPVDYRFVMKPLATESSETQGFIYDLLKALETENLGTKRLNLLLPSSALLADTPELDDLTLVRIFRFIRVVRYLHQTTQGEKDA